jgi:preprotein translocase subunit SecG
MVQKPKGGGLSSTLGGSQMLGGVQNNWLLDKSTYLDISYLLLC